MGVSDVFFGSVGLSRLTLRVADADAVARFYEDGLGFEQRTGPDGRLELFTPQAAEPLVVLEPAPKAPPRPRGAAGLFHVALLYPDRPALGRALARLVRLDIRLGGADHGVSEAVYLSDPEGNGIELTADRPPTLWPPPPADGQVEMFTEALDANAVIEAGQGSEGPLLPAGTRIGHVHLGVTSLDQAEAFYAGELGFPVRQRDYPGARFFGRDGYHHHIGTNTWQSRTPAAAGALGLARFTIALPDAARGIVLEAIRAGGHLDRLEGDTAVALDPNGIEIHIAAKEAP